jgi:isovaleryl-CoA dehydrogenase
LIYNKEEKFNIELFRKLGNENLGILGLTVNEEYGGSGLIDAISVAIVHEELSYSDPAFCLAYLAHSLLLVNNLHINANERQKQLYLPGCCNGTIIGGMCMSEPDAGTDVLGMKTTAVQNNDTNDWIINGTKMWITNGTLDGISTGDLFLVYAKTGPNKFDITQFIVEKNTKGFTLGQQIHNKLGMRSSMTAELVFDNVKVSNDNVIGGPNNAVSCMMRNLEIERIGLAAMAVGIARRSLDEMKNYSLTRTAFTNSIIQYGQIQKMIADSYVEYMAGKSYLYNTAQCININTSGNTMDSDGVKLYCAQMSKTIADRAIQVLGGNGYISDYTVERLWRDAKLLEIGGGTNESHHKNICRDIYKIMNTHTKFH